MPRSRARSTARLDGAPTAIRPARPADAARRVEVEAALARRVAPQARPRLDLHDVRGQIGRRADSGDVAGTSDQPLAREEPDRQRLVLAGSAHSHGERLAVDADL